MGLPSSRLARDPHAMLPELAHEYFHTWNLVAIHPDSYGALSYQRPIPTSGLWMGEGVTLYYADLLLRRAGLADTASSRLAHLADLLTRYHAAPWRTRVSPERASLAFGASPITNADATGGYYLQGELLAYVLDALVRDSTHERRGLDDVMKALYVASADGAGFTSRGLERTVDSVCHCALHHLFESQIRGAAPIDATPVLSRIGLRIIVDTVPATDATGSPLPDRRLGVDFSQSAGPLRLLINNPASVWSSSGLQTGDVLVALGGSAVSSFAEYRRALQASRVGDTIVVDVQRDGRPVRAIVRMTGYLTPRVRFVDLDRVTREQRVRRERWLRGS
jgi:predicted metalloprotease with PDZ domain